MSLKINVPVVDCQLKAEKRLSEIAKQRVQLLNQAVANKMTEKKMFSKKLKYPTEELAIAALKDSRNYQGWWDNEHEALCNYRRDSEKELNKVLEMMSEHIDSNIEIDEKMFDLLGFNYGK